MVAPFVDNYTALEVNGHLQVRWRAVRQASFKVSVYRDAYRGQAPVYGTVRTAGQSLAGGSHRVYNPNTRQVVFDGRVPSSGRVCNGTYVVRMYAANRLEERSVTLSRTVTIRGFPCPQTGGVNRYPLPAPTITSPSVDNHTFDGVNATFTWTVPTGFSQAGYKMSIYRLNDIDINGEPRQGVTPVYGTIREEEHRNDPIRSHWANGALRTLTFSDTSAFTNNQIRNGDYVARLRYRNSLRQESRAAVRYFSVENIGAFEEPEDVGVPASGQGLGVHWLRSSMAANALLPLRLEWNSVFTSQGLQKSFRVRKNLSGVSQYAGDYWWKQRASGVEWDPRNTAYNAGRNEIDSISDGIVVEGGATGNATQKWGDVSWGTHRFYVRVTDTADNVSDESPALEVTPYLPLSISSLSAINDNTGHGVFTFGLNGRIDNNRIEAVKLSIYNLFNWDGTGVPPALIGGTREYNGQSINDEIGARWVSIADLIAGNFVTGITTALNQQVRTLSITCGGEFFQCATFAGIPVIAQSPIVTVRGKLRDVYGNETPVVSAQYSPLQGLGVILSYNLVTCIPLRIISPAEGTRDVVTAAPLTGLAPGFGIAVLTYFPGGTYTSSASNMRFREVWRREESRSDDLPPDQTPRRLHTIDYEAREGQAPLPTWVTITGGVGGGDPLWYLDYEVEEGVQYEYRVRQVASTGAHYDGPWVPA